LFCEKELTMQAFIPSLSTYSHQVDTLFMLILYIMGFWFFLGQFVIFYFLYKFRRKEGVPSHYITGEHKKHKNWVKWPHLILLVCDIVIVIFSCAVWYNIKQNLPAPKYTVKIITQQWAWTFVDPGADGKLDTDDDIATIDELHVQVNTIYNFRLTTKDVIHSFSVPVFRLKQDAVPGREISGWFQATETGTHDIQCVEICGIGHGIMAAKIIIETEAEHQQWVAAHTPTIPIKLGSN